MQPSSKTWDLQALEPLWQVFDTLLPSGRSFVKEHKALYTIYWDYYDKIKAQRAKATAEEKSTEGVPIAISCLILYATFYYERQQYSGPLKANLEKFDAELKKLGITLFEKKWNDDVYSFLCEKLNGSGHLISYSKGHLGTPLTADKNLATYVERQIAWNLLKKSTLIAEPVLHDTEFSYPPLEMLFHIKNLADLVAPNTPLGRATAIFYTQIDAAIINGRKQTGPNAALLWLVETIFLYQTIDPSFGEQLLKDLQKYGVTFEGTKITRTNAALAALTYTVPESNPQVIKTGKDAIEAALVTRKQTRKALELPAVTTSASSSASPLGSKSLVVLAAAASPTSGTAPTPPPLAPSGSKQEDASALAKEFSDTLQKLKDIAKKLEVLDPQLTQEFIRQGDKLQSLYSQTATAQASGQPSGQQTKAPAP